MNKVKILLISSSGGHWVQLNRLLPAFSGQRLFFACTNKSYQEYVPSEVFYAVPEASAQSKFALIKQAISVLILLLRVSPDVVVTTGASAGYFALMFAKRLGKKTIWVDSIANVDALSRSARLVEKHADMFVTQWEHLAKPQGPHYFGSVV